MLLIILLLLVLLTAGGGYWGRARWGYAGWSPLGLVVLILLLLWLTGNLRIDPVLEPIGLFGGGVAEGEQEARVRRWVRGTLDFEPRLPREVTLVLVPVRPGEGLVAWYLARMPGLDARIRARGWPTKTFELAADPAGGSR